MPKVDDAHSPTSGSELPEDAFLPPCEDAPGELELDWDGVRRPPGTVAVKTNPDVELVPSILLRHDEEDDDTATQVLSAAATVVASLIFFVRLVAAIPLSLLPSFTQRRLGLERFPMRLGTIGSAMILGFGVVWLGGVLYHVYQDQMWESLSYIYMETDLAHKGGITMATGMAHFFGFLFLTPVGLALLWTFVEQLVRFASAAIGESVGTTSLAVIEAVVVRIGRGFGWIERPAKLASDHFDGAHLGVATVDAFECTMAYVLAIPASLLPKHVRDRWRLDDRLNMAAGTAMSGALALVIAGSTCFDGSSFFGFAFAFALAFEGLVRLALGFGMQTPAPSVLLCGVAYLYQPAKATAR